MALSRNRTTARRQVTLPVVRSAGTVSAIALRTQRPGGTLPVAVSPEPPSAEASRPRRKRSGVPSLLAADAAAAVLGSALWAVLGADVVGFGLGSGVLAGVVALVWLVALALARSYKPRLSRSGRDSAREVMTAALGLLCAIALGGLLPGLSPSREVVLSGIGMLSGLTLVTRGTVVSTSRRGRHHGRSRVTVVGGDDDVVRRFVEELRTTKDCAVDVVAVCLVGTASGEWCDVPVVRDLDAVDEAVKRLGTEARDVAPVPRARAGPDPAPGLAAREARNPPVRRAQSPRGVGAQGGAVAGGWDRRGPGAHAELDGAWRLAKEAFDWVVAAIALTAVLPLRSSSCWPSGSTARARACSARSGWARAAGGSPC